MDRIKDARILGLIENISNHYKNNISNSYLRPLLLQLNIDKYTWDNVEALTEKTESHRYQGFHLDDLYRQVLACIRFIEAARQSTLPSLRNKLNAASSSGDKIMREMAANNFASNLQVFSSLLQELYKSLVDFDKSSAKKNQKPLYTQMQELRSIDRLLDDLDNA